jgi:post-segregation antitoxin (ccd killing protein)
MANKTIYVRDEELWAKAKAYAAKSNLSMSALIEICLIQWVEKKEGKRWHRKEKVIRDFSPLAKMTW